MSSGRGPTRLMSPCSTLSSSGSSSRLVRRSKRAERGEALGVGAGASPSASRAVGHGAELHHLERAAVAARALLAEQHRRPHAQRARAPTTTASSGDSTHERDRRAEHVDRRASVTSSACSARNQSTVARSASGSAVRHDVGEQLRRRVESACECFTSPARVLHVLDGDGVCRARARARRSSSSRSVRRAEREVHRAVGT